MSNTILDNLVSRLRENRLRPDTLPVVAKVLFASWLMDCRRIGQALQLCRSLEAINRSVLADVFEGVVMKHSRSLQLV